MNTPLLFTRFASIWVVIGAMLLGGCDQVFKTSLERFLDPASCIKAPRTDMTMPIKSSMSPADETEELPPSATAPNEDDLAYTVKDYVIGPNDILDISILDLFSEGLETVLRRQVTESGLIDMPLLPDKIKAEGLTKDQLQDVLIKAYSPDILKNPTVSVTVILQRQNVFSILGAVARPSQYNLTKRDMRLLDCLATAGGRTQTNIHWVLVIRPQPALRIEEGKEQPTTNSTSTQPELPELPTIPQLPRKIPGRTPAGPTSEEGTEPPSMEEPTSEPGTMPAEQPAPATGTTSAESEAADLTNALPGRASSSAPAEETASKAASEPAQEGTTTSAPSDMPTPDAMPRLAEMTAKLGAAASTTSNAATSEVGELENSKSTKWVHTSEGSTAVEQTAKTASRPSGEGAEPVRPRGLASATTPGLPSNDPFGWRKATRSEGARVIAIDVLKLERGENRLNIVIRDNDVIMVPMLEQGEFYVMGEVNRPGVYSLTGRRVTIKMALAASGNLGPMSWPQNSVLVRRIGDYQEQMIPLNIEGIIRGTETDLFLKPDDVIEVGTSAACIFMAVTRNAYRLTYGFGFIYDRNFADPTFFQGNFDFNSQRFTRW